MYNLLSRGKLLVIVILCIARGIAFKTSLKIQFHKSLLVRFKLDLQINEGYHNHFQHELPVNIFSNQIALLFVLKGAKAHIFTICSIPERDRLSFQATGSDHFHEPVFFFCCFVFVFFLHTSVLTFAAFVHTDTVIHMQQQEWFSSACLVTEEMKSKKLSIILNYFDSLDYRTETKECSLLAFLSALFRFHVGLNEADSWNQWQNEVI